MCRCSARVIRVWSRRVNSALKTHNSRNAVLKSILKITKKKTKKNTKRKRVKVGTVLINNKPLSDPPWSVRMFFARMIILLRMQGRDETLMVLLQINMDVTNSRFRSVYTWGTRRWGKAIVTKFTGTGIKPKIRIYSAILTYQSRENHAMTQ